MQELLLLHRPSRSLLVTDLAFNFKRCGGGEGGLAAKGCGAVSVACSWLWMEVGSLVPAAVVCRQLLRRPAPSLQRRRCRAGPWAPSCAASTCLWPAATERAAPPSPSR